MNIDSLISKYDSDNMYECIKGFPKQFTLLYDTLKWEKKRNYEGIDRILILGMGGSAIGGEIVSDILSHHLNISIEVNRGYSLPNWVNDKTLVIASSYSGNTEETISAFNKCDKNYHRIVISSGGELLNSAIESNLDYIILPPGMQPRAALGYSVSAYTALFYNLDLITKSTIQEFDFAIKELTKFSYKFLSNNKPAVDLAKKIYDKMPIIYSENESTSSVGIRFANQLQENSKILSYSSILPEINHNEIEGWDSDEEVLRKIFVIWLCGFDENPQIVKRRDTTFELISSFTNNQTKIVIDASNKIEYMLKLIHFCDLVSFYTAMIKQINPTPVNQISMLKNKLSS